MGAGQQRERKRHAILCGYKNKFETKTVSIKKEKNCANVGPIRRTKPNVASVLQCLLQNCRTGMIQAMDCTHHCKMMGILADHGSGAQSADVVRMA